MCHKMLYNNYLIKYKIILALLIYKRILIQKKSLSFISELSVNEKWFQSETTGN
jgi:hypothetical protein